MSGRPAAEVELVLDVRELRDPPDNPEAFATLWSLIEPALTGRDLSGRRVHQLDGAEGTVRLEVTRLSPGVRVATADTRFSVVAVREQAQLRYRCKQCADNGVDRYGPFLCADRTDQDHRACDEHVIILDGGLSATCRVHLPSCQECARPATFRCAGRSCRRNRAWCDQHRRPHPRDEDVDYCPSCHTAEFPPCEARGCRDIGTVVCEHVSDRFEACGRRMCTRHARRWQVFGGERLGLGRCAHHSAVTGLTADQVVFQIVVGAAARRRRERLPSLQGFSFNLRNSGHPRTALDYRAIHRTLVALPARIGSDGPRAAAEAVSGMRRTWDEQLAKTASAAADGQHLVDRLKVFVRDEDRRYGAEIAAELTLAEYHPAGVRNGVQRRGRLFVNVPERLRGLFIGKEGARKRRYAELLGVDVEIEGGRRRR